MTDVLSGLLMLLAAVGAALVLALALAALGQSWRHAKAHPMVYFIAVVLGAAALSVLLSGRDFSQSTEFVAAPAANANPLVGWINRFSSIFIVAASLERIYLTVAHPDQRASAAPAFLLPAYLVYWVCALAVPAALGAHPVLSHEFLYTLFLGVGACLVTPADSQRSVVLARNGFLAFMIASLSLIPVRPDLVLDFYYTQGLFGNYPRFSGLAAHANVLGPFCVLGLLFLWVQPFQHVGGNRLAWAVLLACLVMTQSKTSWISFSLCVVWLLAYRNARGAVQWLGKERNRHSAAMLLGTCMALILVTSVLFWVADFSTAIDAFLASRIGTQVSTMTGRDLIWETALKEWHAHPLFGYGPSLFDEVHRKAIGMDFATHGHNQVLDTLARSGMVGLAGLLVFVVGLVTHALLAARRTGGLSVALMIVVLFLAIGEVPFNIVTYGPENLAIWLLMMVLCGYATAAGAGAAPNAPAKRTSPPGMALAREVTP